MIPWVWVQRGIGAFAVLSLLSTAEARLIKKNVKACDAAIQVDITPRPDRVGKIAMNELSPNIPKGDLVAFSASAVTEDETTPSLSRQALYSQSFKKAEQISLQSRSAREDIDPEVLDAVVSDGDFELFESKVSLPSEAKDPNVVVHDAILAKNLKHLIYVSDAARIGQISYNTVGPDLYVDYLDYVELSAEQGKELQKYLLANVLSENPQIRRVHIILRFGTNPKHGDVPRVRASLAESLDSFVQLRSTNDSEIRKWHKSNMQSKPKPVQKAMPPKSEIIPEVIPEVIYEEAPALENSLEDENGVNSTRSSPATDSAPVAEDEVHPDFIKESDAAVGARLEKRNPVEVFAEIKRIEAWKKRIQTFNSRTEFDLKRGLKMKARYKEAFLVPKVPESVFLRAERHLSAKDKPLQSRIHNQGPAREKVVLSSPSEVQAAVELGMRVGSASVHETGAAFADVVLDFSEADLKAGN